MQTFKKVPLGIAGIVVGVIAMGAFFAYKTSGSENPMTFHEIDALLLGALLSVTSSSREVLFLALFGSLILGTVVQVAGFKLIVGTMLESKNRAWYGLGVSLVVLAYWVYWLAIRTLPHFH